MYWLLGLKNLLIFYHIYIRYFFTPRNKNLQVQLFIFMYEQDSYIFKYRHLIIPIKYVSSTCQASIYLGICFTTLCFLLLVSLSIPVTISFFFKLLQLILGQVFFHSSFDFRISLSSVMNHSEFLFKLNSLENNFGEIATFL